MTTLEKYQASKELQAKIAHLDEIRKRLDIFRSESGSFAAWVILHRVLTKDDRAGFTQNINAMRDGLGALMETFVSELKNIHANDTTAL